MRLLPYLAVALLSLPGLRAESLVVPKPFFHPQDGETVVFLGDSITHQAFYTQYLETFFYTRYPDRRIRFHNAGVGGDKAADALDRFDTDVASHDPDYVTVLLGMNDGHYEPFSDETLANYRDGMTDLLRKIRDLGADAVVLSPTIFDHHQFARRQDDDTYRFRDRPFHDDYNSLLAYYSNWLRQHASANQLPFVDLRAPLSRITFSLRRTNPDFTLVEDAIHPGAAGHFIMAATILEASMPERPEVSRIEITRHHGTWSAGENGNVSALSGNESLLTFEFLADSLPWVAPETATTKELRWGPSTPATRGYELANSGHRLSREFLRIDDLPPGRYNLSIDETDIATFTDEQLDRGVDLQSYAQSPQSQQSLEVALLNRDRNDEVIRPMRDLWSQVKSERRKNRPGEEAAVKTLELREQIDRLHEEAADFESAIYKLARPVPRHYTIRRLKAP